MPELGEVEIVRRNLVDWWVGRTAEEIRLHDEQLATDTEPDRLVEVLGRRLDEIRRRGKYLIADMAGDSSVIFHFRMTGKIICCDEPDPDYARLAWRVVDSGWLVFRDQRRLGEARIVPTGELETFGPLAKMGPEPEDVTVEHLREVCSDRRMLKTALLDQSVVAGVGNIAVSELLWRLQLAPDVRCGQLTDEDWEALVDELPRYFAEVVADSMADEVVYFGEAGEPVDPFQIYGGEGEQCPRCGEPIEKSRVGGRSSYFCGACQG